MKKRQIIASLAALLLSSNTCFADFLYQDGEFFINGELGADFAEKAVAIEVFAPGKDFSDITSENIMSVMPYKTQVKTDSEGKYEISFKLLEDTASGEYNAFIFANGVSKTEKLLFSNPKRAKAAAELMNEAFSSEAEDSVKKADIAQIIEDYSADLKIPESILREDTAENATELIFAYLGNGAVDENNVCEVSTKAAGIAALNAGTEINITENADIFDLKNSEIKDFYEKNYVTSDTGADMAARLAEKDFESFEEFDEALLESFILAVVKNPDGSDNVKELLKEFASEIGIDEDGKTKQYTGVAGKDYDRFSDLKEAFEDYGKESTGGGGGGSSSSKGSSSGGGKSAGVGTIVTIPEASKPVEVSTYPMTVFDDLAGFPWAEDAIVYLAERSMINGKGNQKFCPGDNITREEFVKIIVNALEVEPESLKALSFTDVDSDDWYYSFVQKAYSAGVVGGFSDTYFGTGQNITREDMATMIVRAAKASGIVFSEPEEDDRFADSDTLSDYAKDSVHILKKAGIVNGVLDNNFAPKAYATRAEAAKMIYGLIRN